MDINTITRSLSLLPPPVATSNPAAAEDVQANATEAAKVTPPPASGDPATQGGTSGQPGLGGNVDLYDTNAAKSSAEKTGQSATQTKAAPLDEHEKAAHARHRTHLHLLGKGSGLPDAADFPPDPDFPFLVPLGQKKPGQVFDAKI